MLGNNLADHTELQLAGSSSNAQEYCCSRLIRDLEELQGEIVIITGEEEDSKDGYCKEGTQGKGSVFHRSDCQSHGEKKN